MDEILRAESRLIYIRILADLLKIGVAGITPFLIAFETKADYYCSADSVCEASANNQTLKVTYAGTKGIKNPGFKDLVIDISGLGRISGYMFSNPSIYGIYQPSISSSLSEGQYQPYLSYTSLINNEGFISGTTAAIYNELSQNIGTIENRPNATISGYLGIANGGSIEAIYNAANGNIIGRSVAMQNTSTIAQIDNRGIIKGLEGAWLASYGIFNTGTIALLKNLSSGTISGSGSYGSGVDNSGIITTIENLAGGTITGANAVSNSGTGTIESLKNSGTISGSGSYGSGVDNSGIITTIENLAGGSINSITNNGSITSVKNKQGGVSSGSIYNSVGSIATIVNSGAINGYGIINFGTINSIKNFGVISRISNNGSINTLENNGLIESSIRLGSQNLIVHGTGSIGSLSNYSFISGDPGSQLSFQSSLQNIYSLYSYTLPAVDVDSQSTITLEWPSLFSLSPDMLSGSGNIVLQNTETSARPEKYFVIDQGRSTFSGSIVVNNGISVSLERNSDIGNAASLRIRSGSFIAGSGRLPSTLISSDARVSPSDFGCNEVAELSCLGWERLPGRIQIAGDLSLSPGSTTELSVFRVSSDNLAVDGRASLSGTLQLDFPDNFYESSYLYDLLTAASISGEYELVTGILPGHVYDVLYKPGSVQLSLFKAITPGESTNASDPASNIINGGSLIVDSSGSYGTDYIITPLGATINTDGSQSTFSGIFSGPGGLIFSNTAFGGSISLAGLNTYIGSTAVGNNATLFVNGSIATSSGLTVSPGGTIGGNGQLPATTISSGGIMAPGNSIGTLTVNGNYSLNDGTLAIELQGPMNDQIVVTGNVAPFTGTASLISFGGGTVWPGFTYSILTANASAPFATPSSLTLDQTQITPSALLQLGTTLIQDADGNAQTFDVQWRPTNSAGATTTAMQVLGQTGVNQMATAGALDRVFQSLATNSANNSNNTGALIGSTGFTSGQASASGISLDFLSVTSQLLNLSSGSQLTSAITSLSPEPYAAFQSVGLDTLKRQRELLMSQAGNCVHTGWIVNTSTNKKKNSLENPLCMFAQVANATSSISGSGGLSSYDSGIFSSFYGIEYQPSMHWTIGASYGYGTSRLNNMALSSSSVTSSVNSGSIYGVYKPTERWTLRSLFGYANFNSTGRRNVSFVGNGSTIQGSPTGNGFTLAINADYLVNLTRASAQTQAYLKPIVGIAWGSYQQDGFGESAGGPLNLDVQGNTANSLVGTIGFELATSPIPLNKNNTIAIRLRLAVAYQVDALGNDTGAKSLTSSFQSAPAAGTSVTQGENMGINALLVDGGFDITLSNSASIYANVGYEITSNGSQLTYGGGMKVRF